MSAKHIFWQIVAIVFIAPVFAEDTEESPDEPKIYEFEEITVTGSRIKSAESLSPAPVVVLSSDEIKARGLTSIGDVLQTLTVQSNATNTQSNNGGDGSTRINLRGLGSNRTLVLVNGRRFVPGGTGANSSVDLNSIPASVIERVEVLKDGASAVYGSDAIGGVVNIITRSDMERVEIDYYEGMSGAGDGEVRDLSITAGLQSAKGHILFSAGYHNRKPVWTGDRSFSVSDKNYDWGKTTAPITKTAVRPPQKATSSTAWVPRATKPGRRLLRRQERTPGITTAIQIRAGVPSTGRGSPQMEAVTRTIISLKITSTPHRRATVPFSAALTNSQKMRKLSSKYRTPIANPIKSWPRRPCSPSATASWCRLPIGTTNLAAILSMFGGVFSKRAIATISRISIPIAWSWD